jgi:hypothetical protein
VLGDAKIRATAIIAQARTDAQQIIATARLQRTQSRYPHQAQPGQAAQTAPAITGNPAPIMVLNDRRRIYAPLNADARTPTCHRTRPPATESLTGVAVCGLLDAPGVAVALAAHEVLSDVMEHDLARVVSPDCAAAGKRPGRGGAGQLPWTSKVNRE